MKNHELAVMIGAAAVTLCAGVWFAKRSHASATGATAPTSTGYIAQLGFTWNPQTRSYTKVNADGSVSTYGGPAADIPPDFYI